VIGLSEESQVAYLQGKLSELERRANKRGINPLIGGVFLFFTGGVFWAMIRTIFLSAMPIAFTIGIAFIIAIVGAILFIFGLIETIHYYGELKSCYRELATRFPNAIPICPHCKKTLLKGNSEFCSLCGKPLKVRHGMWMRDN
jgi:hypothetical protein